MNPTQLFGSDVYENYTAVYTWNSNQMAHATMGFAGTTLLAAGFVALGCSPWWGLLFIIIPALKDITDFAVDRTRAGHIFQTTDDHVRELRQDGLTDNWFWNTGTLFAIFIAVGARGGAWASWILFVVALAWALGGIVVLGRKFNAQKLLYDISSLPYFFRLPNFAGNPIASIELGETEEARTEDRAEAVSTIEAFAYGQSGRADHLVVSGPPRCRKTTLASAIGSDLTVRGRKVRYLPLSTLADELGTPPPGDRAKSEPLPPQEAEIVIVDDVDAACPTDLGRHLANKSTIWVVADPTEAEILRRRLRGQLEGRIVAIELGPPQPEDRVDQQPIAPWLTALSAGTLALAAIAILGSLASILF